MMKLAEAAEVWNGPAWLLIKEPDWLAWVETAQTIQQGKLLGEYESLEQAKREAKGGRGGTKVTKGNFGRSKDA